MSHSALRRGLALVAASVLALTLSACTDSSEESDEQGTDSSSGESTDGAFPVTVETKFGAVEITEKPEKVVALGWGDAEVALALGVQPIGASDWLAFGEDANGVGPWASDLYDETPEFFGTTELDTQAIGALEPDLILDVRSEGTQERHDALTEITPNVISIPEGADGWTTTTEEQVTMISQALGLPEDGEELLADVDAAFADAVEAHPEFAGRTATVSAKTSEGWGVYTAVDARQQFMTELGFAEKPEVAALGTESFSVPVAGDQLELLDADVVVSFPIFIEASAITGDDLYNALPAVEDGRSILIDDPVLANAFSAATPLSIQYAIDAIVPLLADATAR
ncbi:ABC transporter substrate-binding protein [Nocardioides dongxiaopingii]|uniref:ABC transporter substrate-binding protein n=1 Tax=Nocardioides sp. S-1144 TaxID=2582905 RepID=UPI0011642404|nr:ABC transporter substrate-binding protein [Nocardioides sp. S-1144]QCW50748.2 ABC transporter substrate-binding protein [Nocardioides sp. S-1144]